MSWLVRSVTVRGDWSSSCSGAGDGFTDTPGTVIRLVTIRWEALKAGVSNLLSPGATSASRLPSKG